MMCSVDRCMEHSVQTLKEKGALLIGTCPHVWGSPLTSDTPSHHYDILRSHPRATLYHPVGDARYSPLQTGASTVDPSNTESSFSRCQTMVKEELKAGGPLQFGLCAVVGSPPLTRDDKL